MNRYVFYVFVFICCVLVSALVILAVTYTVGQNTVSVYVREVFSTVASGVQGNAFVISYLSKVITGGVQGNAFVGEKVNCYAPIPARGSTVGYSCALIVNASGTVSTVPCFTTTTSTTTSATTTTTVTAVGGGGGGAPVVFPSSTKPPVTWVPPATTVTTNALSNVIIMLRSNPLITYIIITIIIGFVLLLIGSRRRY